MSGSLGKIGVAVIGLGARGFKSVRDALKLPDVRLVVGCEIRDDRRSWVERELGIRAEKDWSNLVARPDIDLVYVATPNDQHAEMACAAMEAGKSVLLQKPMAHNICACRQIMAAQKQTQAFLQIGFECRYSLLYVRAKELVDSGQAGRIRNFHMDYFQSMWEVWLEHPGGWKWLAERSGGLIAEKLSHYIDLFQWMTGSPVAAVDVFAAEPVLSYFETNDSLHVGMRTENGAVGVITFSFCRASTAENDQTEGMDGGGKGHRTELTFIGEQGTIYLHDYRVLDLFLYDKDGETKPFLAATENFTGSRWDLVHNTKDELTDVVQRVVSKQPPALSPEVAYQVFEVCFAAEESIRRRGPVRLADWKAGLSV